MAVNESYKQFIEDQLEGFPGLRSKNMFGGVGYFRDEFMFGAIMHGKFRLKADDVNKTDFLNKGMGPHQIPGKKMTMPYYEVPAEILDDREELWRWAERSVEAAKRTKKK